MTLTSPEPGHSDELHCPLCEYDLRGLTEPRCPECGYRFDWEELRDRSRHLHPFLFEHHPERNVRSFIHTALAGWRPVLFWKTLRPQMTLVPRRMVIYWGVCTLMPWFLATMVWASSIAIDRLSPRVPSPFARAYINGGIVRYHPAARLSPWDMFMGRAYDLGKRAEVCVPMMFLILGWTVATFLALLIFQQSMAKAKVLPMHMVRCVGYSFDFGLWLTFYVGAFCILYCVAGDIIPDPILLWIGGGLAVFGMVKLWTAYRCYLQFDHAFFVILSSQVIAFLAVLLVLVNLDPVTRMF